MMEFVSGCRHGRTGCIRTHRWTENKVHSNHPSQKDEGGRALRAEKSSVGSLDLSVETGVANGDGSVLIPADETTKKEHLR